MQGAEIRGWCHPELIRQQLPDLLVPTERLGRTTAAMQAEDESVPESLPKRVVGDQPLHLRRDHPCLIAIEREVALSLDGLQHFLFQADSDIVSPSGGSKPTQRAAPPQPKSFGEQCCLLKRIGTGSGFLAKPPETD